VSKSPSINHEAEALKEELEAANQRADQIQDNLQSTEIENSKLSRLLLGFLNTCLTYQE